jgi:hypothetical protein
MANKATKESVAADMRPPGFRAAISLIRTQLNAKKDKIASINGELADMWAKVVGHKVDKFAAKTFAKLDGLETTDRVEFFRSFNGLAANADWPEIVVDLVDAAEGNKVTMRLGPDAHLDDGDDAEQGGEDDGPAADKANDFIRGRRAAGAVPDALDGAKLN